MQAQFNNQNLAAQFRPETLPVGWPWRLFSFSAILFALALFSFFGLEYGYVPYLDKEIKKQDQLLAELNNSIPSEQRDSFVLFYSQLSNLKNVLNGHLSASGVFAQILEKDTHPKVYFSTAGLSVPERKLVIEGFAASYGVLSEQLAAFDKDPLIERYLLEQSQYSDGLVQFKVDLTLATKVFKR